MSTEPIFIGKFTAPLKSCLKRRLQDRGVRFFVRSRDRIIALTAFGKEIFITITRSQIRSLCFWFHEDALSPVSVHRFRKLKMELNAVMVA